MALLNVTPYDKFVYETELKDFLPKRFIDCHAHIWRPEHNPVDHLREGSQNWPRLVAKNANTIEELNETNRLLFPDNEVISVLYGDCAVSVDRPAINKYVPEKARENNFPALYLAHPSQSAEELEQAVLAYPEFKGIKVYLQFAPSYIPADEIRIYDFLTKEHLAVCDKHGWFVQLHIARPKRLADPVNYMQLLEIEQNYPNLTLSVAHLGRAYANEDVGDALEYLKNTEKMVWDFTANTNDWVMEQVLKYFGPDRMMYGSDFPIFRMKSRRVIENGIYVNEVPKGQFPYESIKNDPHMREIDFPEADKITFFIYEEMLASKRALARLGLGKDAAEKIYFGTAAKIFGVK